MPGKAEILSLAPGKRIKSDGSGRRIDAEPTRPTSAKLARQTRRLLFAGVRTRKRTEGHRARRSAVRSWKPRALRLRRLQLPADSHRTGRAARRPRRDCYGRSVPKVR